MPCTLELSLDGMKQKGSRMDGYEREDALGKCLVLLGGA